MRLWKLGQDIGQYLQLASKQEKYNEYEIQEDIKIRLDSLFLCHNLYISSFVEIHEMIDRLAKSQELYFKYQNVSTFLPFQVGKSFVDEETILAKQTADIASDVFSEEEHSLPETQGRRAMAVSFLRGIFQEISVLIVRTSHLLPTSSGISDNIAGIIQNHDKMDLLKSVIRITLDHKDEMSAIAEMFPHYFFWLRNLGRLAEIIAPYLG